MIAVLSRHAGVRLGDADVFVSVAGGARALDPAADLAMALAITSAHRGIPLAPGSAAFGELGPDRRDPARPGTACAGWPRWRRTASRSR